MTPPIDFWPRMRETPNRSHHRIGFGIKPPPVMDAVVISTTSCAEIVGMIGAFVPLLDQVARGIDAALAAWAADAAAIDIFRALGGGCSDCVF